jgi:hypothetical protein
MSGVGVGGLVGTGVTVGLGVFVGIGVGEGWGVAVGVGVDGKGVGVEVGGKGVGVGVDDKGVGVCPTPQLTTNTGSTSSSINRYLRSQSFENIIAFYEDLRRGQQKTAAAHNDCCQLSIPIRLPLAISPPLTFSFHFTRGGGLRQLG